MPATQPSASFEFVRSYTSHPSAVDTMWWPTTENSQPAEKSKKFPYRKAA